MTDEELINEYNVNDCEHPSVAIDVVCFRIDSKFKLQVLLLEREQHPFMSSQQLPGGFVDMSTELEVLAQQYVTKKAGMIKLAYLGQLQTYDAVQRDPRTRVISIVYLGIVPQDHTEHLQKKCAWFDVTQVDSLAFDHVKIIQDALIRLQNKLSYCDIALNFLKDKTNFTIYEVQKIYETITNKEYNPANFRRDFINRYVRTNKVKAKENFSTRYSNRPSCLYTIVC